MLDKLNSLFNSQEDRILCHTDFQGGTVSLTKLMADMTGLRGRIEASAARTWLLSTQDTYLFALGFLTLLGLGKTVVLCANSNPGWIRQFSNQFDATLTDEPLNVDDKINLSFELDTPADPLWRPFFGGQERLVFFTSGSTGAAKPVEKPLASLIAEVVTLERQFGSQLGDSVLLASVSHQHIYGLLFKLLWPLLRSRQWVNKVIEFPEQLHLASRMFPDAVFVSSPAFLSRLDANLSPLKLRQVFSSGGPLALSDARLSRQLLGCLPLEVYGSTETGGIAWRQSARAHHPWTLFPGLALKSTASGCLLSSPHVAAPGMPLLDDELELLSEERFLLKGRKDRVVKIEEKRISLSEIELHLQSHENISRCVALPIQRSRLTIGCAVLLSAKGNRLLQEKGQKVLINQWKNYCLEKFEPVTLPRKWRIVPSMKMNAQGKIDMQEVTALFESGVTPRPELPEITKVEKTDNSVELQLHIAENLAVFDGHFEGAPVLPGVVQIKWAIELARQYLGISRSSGVETLKSVKFQHVIRPGQDVTLKMIAENDQIDFSFSSTVPHSSGKIEIV